MADHPVSSSEDLEVTLSMKERLGMSAGGFASNLVWNAMGSYILLRA